MKRSIWIGPLVLLAFAAPLGYRLLRGPKQDPADETSTQAPQPALQEPARVSQRNTNIPTTPSTRSSDATEQEWDLERPIQVTYERGVASADAGALPLPFADAGAATATPIDVRAATAARASRRARRAIAGDGGVKPLASTAATQAPPAATPGEAKQPEPASDQSNLPTFRLRPPRAQEF